MRGGAVPTMAPSAVDTIAAEARIVGNRSPRVELALHPGFAAVESRSPGYRVDSSRAA